MVEKEGFIAVKGCRICGKCDGVCPHSALSKANGVAMVDHEKCELCMKCADTCPIKALFYIE